MVHNTPLSSPKLETLRQAVEAGNTAALDEEQRSALAEAMNAEIEPAFQEFIEGDEELYPTSTHIALARKP